MSVATPTKDSLDGRIFAPADRSALMPAAAPAAEADRLKMPHGGGRSERGCRERRIEPGRLSRRTSELPTTSSIDAAGEAARGVRMPASVGWNVLQVVPGQEQSMAERAASLVGPELLSACFPLRYELLKKQQGAWRLVTEVMFPGYVFLATGDIDALRERLHHDLTRRWEGVLDCHRNQEFLDVVPAGATKGAGLRALLDGPLAGQDIEVWTIGDSWNDLDMHAVADHAVALPWSPPEVTAACETTVGSMAELITTILEGDRHE